MRSEPRPGGLLGPAAGALALALCALVVAVVAPPPAHAALRWRTCREAPGARCAWLRVPLDRLGALPGHVRLRVARLTPRRRGRPVLVYLSGGPGGAGITEAGEVTASLRPLLRRFDVVAFDQRGTGRSGAIVCPALQRDVRLRSAAAAAACAAHLGAARGDYTTRDTVADLEALRAAVHARRLTLLGISYGTQVALAYAQAHPGRVARLVLDSVVDPQEADPFALASWQAMGPTLRALCPAGCRRISRDPAADLATLVARLRAAPLRGAAYDLRGRTRAPSPSRRSWTSCSTPTTCPRCGRRCPQRSAPPSRATWHRCCGSSRPATG
jgi:pimeloyl-ACP methyl ester carboxylesterase